MSTISIKLGLEPLTDVEQSLIKQLPIHKSSEKASNCAIAFFQEIPGCITQYLQPKIDICRLGSGTNPIDEEALLAFYENTPPGPPTEKMSDEPLDPASALRLSFKSRLWALERGLDSTGSASPLLQKLKKLKLSPLQQNYNTF